MGKGRRKYSSSGGDGSYWYHPSTNTRYPLLSLPPPSAVPPLLPPLPPPWAFLSRPPPPVVQQQQPLPPTDASSKCHFCDFRTGSYYEKILHELMAHADAIQASGCDWRMLSTIIVGWAEKFSSPPSPALTPRMVHKAVQVGEDGEPVDAFVQGIGPLLNESEYVVEAVDALTVEPEQMKATSGSSTAPDCVGEDGKSAKALVQVSLPLLHELESAVDPVGVPTMEPEPIEGTSRPSTAPDLVGNDRESAEVLVQVGPPSEDVAYPVDVPTTEPALENVFGDSTAADVEMESTDPPVVSTDDDSARAYMPMGPGGPEAGAADLTPPDTPSPSPEHEVSSVPARLPPEPSRAPVSSTSVGVKKLPVGTSSDPSSPTSSADSDLALEPDWLLEAAVKDREPTPELPELYVVATVGCRVHPGSGPTAKTKNRTGELSGGTTGAEDRRPLEPASGNSSANDRAEQFAVRKRKRKSPTEVPKRVLTACPECDEKFALVAALARHIEKVHRVSAEVNVQDRVCSVRSSSEGSEVTEMPAAIAEPSVPATQSSLVGIPSSPSIPGAVCDADISANPFLPLLCGDEVRMDSSFHDAPPFSAEVSVYADDI